MRSKMGDLEAILAQSPSAAAFGDKGFKLILIGMCLKWSRGMFIATVSLILGIMYGPQAASLLLGMLVKRLGF